jgi:hypothetical protein
LAVGIEQRGCAALYRYLSGIARPKPVPVPGVAEAPPKPLDSTAG